MESTSEPLVVSHPDPEIADVLIAAAATERLVSESLRRLGPTYLGKIPRGQVWSAAETIGHLLDVEIAYGHHLRCILSQDTPRLSQFDEEKLATQGYWRTRDLPELLTAWSTLRRTHLVLISRLDADMLARGGILPDSGHPITAREIALRFAIQDRFHLSQLGVLEETLLRTPA